MVWMSGENGRRKLGEDMYKHKCGRSKGQEQLEQKHGEVIRNVLRIKSLTREDASELKVESCHQLNMANLCKHGKGLFKVDKFSPIFLSTTGTPLGIKHLYRLHIDNPHSFYPKTRGLLEMWVGELLIILAILNFPCSGQFAIWPNDGVAARLADCRGKYTKWAPQSRFKFHYISVSNAKLCILIMEHTLNKA